MITIDFETRSRLDLRKVGSHVYACEPTTSILCLAWKFPNQEEKLWAPDRFARISGYQIDDPDELFQAVESGELVEAHNAGFERRIWSEILVRRFDAPEVPFESWRCSMAKAASMGLPQSLEMLAKALKLPIQKDKAGNAAMKKLTAPIKLKKRDPNQGQIFNVGSGPVFLEDPALLSATFDYCKQDVRTEEAASEKLEELPERELRVWQLDQRINDRGFRIDRELCRSAIQATEAVDRVRGEELERITGGAVSRSSQTKRIKEFLGSNGYPITSLAADEVESMLAGRHVSGVNRRVLEIRLETAKSSVKKFRALLDRTGPDGRMRDILRYYGAFTGRWSGAGAQVQNFPRGSIQDIELLAETFLDQDPELLELWFGDIHEAAKSVTRAALTADPGNKLLVWDFGQIEARALAFLAGDEVALEIFREYDAGTGPDPYVALARDIYGDGSLTKKDKEKRQVGKAGVLGLGYAMGSTTFLGELERYGVANATERFSKMVVNTFREKFKATADFWHQLERAAKNTIKSGESSRVNSIQFSKRGSFLLMTLPSGRSLYYLDARLMTGHTFGKRTGLRVNNPDRKGIVYSQVKNKKLALVQTYGGKLAENATQAIARDLLVDGMLALHEAGYPLNATIHDEIVAEVPENETERTLDRGSEILQCNEVWSIGLPLVADGFETKRYRKD